MSVSRKQSGREVWRVTGQAHRIARLIPCSRSIFPHLEGIGGINSQRISLSERPPFHPNHSFSDGCAQGAATPAFIG
eukprot:1192645-Prorocentrum_minimum.AAC.3